MSLSANTIRPSDISISPVKLKYSSSFAADGSVLGITFPGTPITSQFGINDDPLLMDITGSQSRAYRLVKQLYYQNYLTGSVLGTASYWDSNQQSTAYSGSDEYEYRYIPTGSNDIITVIYIPPIIANEQISRLSFNLSPTFGNPYDIWDDGNGNLIDKANNNLHIGNIIYSNGVIIITDTNYAPAFVMTSVPTGPYYTPTGPIAGYVDTTPGLYVLFTP